MTMLQQIHPAVETYPPLWGKGRLDKFALREALTLEKPSERTEQLPEPSAEVVEALARLTAAGLVSRVPAGARLRIIGGTSKSTDSGITIYQEGFIIALERDRTFFAGVAGPGNLGEERRTKTLSEATDAVLDIYRTRRLALQAKAPR